MIEKKKPVVGIFTFSCCQGCQFTILFLEELMDILDKVDMQHFHLLKEKNVDAKFDLVFVEGTITTKKQIVELKNIRKNSKFLVALGACAAHGGVPAMRNFIRNDELQKYVYNQKTLEDSVEASAVDCHVKVDYTMRGCPIMKKEFVDFIDRFVAGKFITEFKGSVCDDDCPRRGVNCFLREKKPCLGAVTVGGCGAICIKENIPCVLCRGPLEKANLPAEIKLFKNFGLSSKDVHSKLTMFASCEIVEEFEKEMENLEEEAESDNGDKK